MRRINRSFPLIALGSLLLPFLAGLALSGGSLVDGGLSALLWAGLVRPSSCTTSPGASTRSATSSAAAASTPTTTPPTSSGSRCHPSARPGTTTTTRSRSRIHGLRWYELDPSGWLILASRASGWRGTCHGQPTRGPRLTEPGAHAGRYGRRVRVVLRTTLLAPVTTACVACSSELVQARLLPRERCHNYSGAVSAKPGGNPMSCISDPTPSLRYRRLGGHLQTRLETGLRASPLTEQGVIDRMSSAQSRDLELRFSRLHQPGCAARDQPGTSGSGRLMSGFSVTASATTLLTSRSKSGSRRSVAKPTPLSPSARAESIPTTRYGRCRTVD